MNEKKRIYDDNRLMSFKLLYGDHHSKMEMNWKKRTKERKKRRLEFFILNIIN